MHLSQPEGRAVIAVKSYDSKSIALRRPTVRQQHYLHFLPAAAPSPPSQRQRAAWPQTWFLLTLCLRAARAVGRLWERTGAPNPSVGEGTRGICWLRWWALGSLCRLQSSASCFHHNGVQVFRKPSHRVLVLCVFWCVDLEQVPLPGFRRGQDDLAG